MTLNYDERGMPLEASIEYIARCQLIDCALAFSPEGRGRGFVFGISRAGLLLWMRIDSTSHMESMARELFRATVEVTDEKVRIASWQKMGGE